MVTNKAKYIYYYIIPNQYGYYLKLVSNFISKLLFMFDWQTFWIWFKYRPTFRCASSFLKYYSLFHFRGRDFLTLKNGHGLLQQDQFFLSGGDGMIKTKCWWRRSNQQVRVYQNITPHLLLMARLNWQLQKNQMFVTT